MDEQNVDKMNRRDGQVPDVGHDKARVLVFVLWPVEGPVDGGGSLLVRFLRSLWLSVSRVQGLNKENKMPFLKKVYFVFF